MTSLHAVQLAAGSEHIINGRTVRINLAGPRPDQMQQQLGLLQNDFLPQLQGMAWAGQQPQALSAQQGAAWPADPTPGLTEGEGMSALITIASPEDNFQSPLSCVCVRCHAGYI